MEVTLEPKTKGIFYAHGELMKIHTRALACHCECLGMNAENCVAACTGTAVPYSEIAYQASLLKWGLIGEDGDITIQLKKEKEDGTRQGLQSNS